MPIVKFSTFDCTHQRRTENQIPATARNGTYLDRHPTLNDRVMFVSVSESDPAAAWMKINDPVGELKKIQSMVANGFLVRTRADSETTQSRTNDTTQREKAFASGAQFVSTDYPRADLRFSDYCVQFEKARMVRINPIAKSP